MAANAQAIRAGRAFVELFADDTKLVRGLRAAERKLQAFGAGVQTIGKSMFGLGSAVVAPILGAVAAFNDAGSQLDDMSQRTGVSVEALSELGYAAQLSGSNLETLDPRDKPALPGTIKMAANFTKSLAAHVADGLQKVEAPELQHRLEICTLCDQRNDDRCSVCGCYLAEKASWRSSECPLGKWAQKAEVSHVE